MNRQKINRTRSFSQVFRCSIARKTRWIPMAFVVRFLTVSIETSVNGSVAANGA
jgi:hypothetical protein